MTEKRDYILKPNYLSGVVPDATVIVKKSFFPFLPRVKRLIEPEKHDPFTFTMLDAAEERYPCVNSYYTFTEDVDAYARVHHLLESKRSSDSLEKEELPKEVIEYSDIKALHQYLRSKPMSFLFLGKPGLGEEEIGKRLAEYWKCVYIDPLTLLQEEIESESRPGQCIEFNLRCGRAIGIDVLTRLLARRVQSSSVLHRGFVLCGFPLIPNDLYEEDPISSESAVFNVREIFDDIFDNTVRAVEYSTKVAVSMASLSRESEKASETEEIMERLSSPQLTMEWSVDNQVCGPTDISTDLEKQLNCIFGIFREPYIIFYIAAKTSDVVLKRDNYLFDIYSKKTVDMQKLEMFYEMGASNENLTEDLFGNGNNPFAENPTLRHLVKLPENFPANVNTQLDRYHSNIANIVDLHVLQHTQHHFLKLDGRSYFSQMMRMIKLHLKILPLQPVIIPQGFTTSFEDAGEGAAPNEIEKMTPEEAFPVLSRQDLIQPVYKWSWSNWGTFCPVFMTQGIYGKGLTKYAVHFVDKIYFMANERNYYRFIKNPRPFLLPPFPKSGCSVWVFGPPRCGKSIVAKCLGYLLDSKVLTPDEMHKSFLQQAVEECKEQVKQVAIVEALEILKDKSVVQMQERQNQIEQWVEEATGKLKDLSSLYTVTETVQEISSFPMKMRKETDVSSMYQESIIRQDLEALNIPQDIDHEYCLQLLENQTALMKYLPDDLKKEVPPPTIWDPFVSEYANTKVEAVEYEHIKKRVQENLYEMYTCCIRFFENQSELAGCIIDGMTTDVTVLQQVLEEFPIQDIIILRSDFQFLIEQFKKEHKRALQFRNFRDFFISIKESDAAARVPIIDLSAEYKQGMAADLVSDIVTAVFTDEDLENEREMYLQQYEEALIRYEKEIEEVQKFLESLDLRPLYIDTEDLSPENLLKEAVTALRDKYRISASELSEADRAEEIQQFLSQKSQEPGDEEGVDSVPDELIAVNRRYGDTYYYDAVIFANRFVLWRGKEQFAAKFNEKVYLFATEANMKSFIKTPRKYLLQFYPPDTFPPPRISVIGPDGDLTTKVCDQLAKNLGTRYMNFLQIKKDAVNALSSTSLLFEAGDEVELSDALLYDWFDTFFSDLWFEEPTKYNGFVLDAFPINGRDLSYMISKEAIPDAIICVHMSEEEYLKQELEKFLPVWRHNTEKNREEQKAVNSIVLTEWAEQREVRYKELIEAKRDNRYSKKLSEENKEGMLPDIEEEPNEKEDLLSATQISVDSIIEQQEHDDVMKILDEELPEPILDESEESEEDAIKQFTEAIKKGYDAYANSFQEMKQICDDELIPFVEINGTENFDKVMRHAYLVGNEAKFRGRSFFERCYDVPVDVAEKLLESGYFFLSFFGRYCPVQGYIADNPLHMFCAQDSRGGICTVIHRQYIYFIHGKQNRARFVHNPLKYIQTNWPQLTIIPSRVSIIGPPKSGTTTITKRFASRLGYNSVSRGEAIRYVLSNPLYTNLIASMENVLRKGEELTDEMVMECVNAATFCGEAVTQGLLFDGFPNTISEMNEMSRLGLTPHLIIDLQVTEEGLYKQAAIPNDKVLQYSQRFIAHRFEEWQKSQETFRVWCHREYQTIYKLPVDRSIWGVYERGRDVLLAQMFERKYYYKNIKFDVPLRLANMLITPLEFLERQGAYKTYCPGCIYYDDKLTNGGDPPNRTGLLQYGKYFYWLCEKHIEDFLKNPDKFFPPSNEPLPEHLPKIVKLSEEPTNAFEDGYCVVCYQKNFPKKVLIKGNSENVVEYRSQLYLFDNWICLSCFMATPHKLGQVIINFKQNIPSSLEYSDLPILGMLEQYVARNLVRAIYQAHTYRPVIPGLSIVQAALICIGLNLKVYNAKGRYRANYKEALERFHQKRLNLIHFLDVMKRYLNPLVHYEEPDTPSSSSEHAKDDEEDSKISSSSSLA